MKVTTRIDSITSQYRWKGKKLPLILCSVFAESLIKSVKKSEEKPVHLCNTYTSIFTQGTNIEDRGQSSFLQFDIGTSVTDGFHDCFLHVYLKKDQNPPIASCRLTFWTLFFFLRGLLLWKQDKVDHFSLSSGRKFLRSLCRGIELPILLSLNGPQPATTSDIA